VCDRAGISYNETPKENTKQRKLQKKILRRKLTFFRARAVEKLQARVSAIAENLSQTEYLSENAASDDDEEGTIRIEGE
jgi:hypothetical protein